MNAVITCYYTVHNAIFGRLKYLDGLAPLALRLYLVPVFWVAGMTKISGIENTIAWFGGSLGLPFPTLMAYLAAYTEAVGAILLALGLATRWVAVPLMITMLVAIFTVHWEHGWSAIAPSNAEEIAVRLSAARDILREHGDYRWLTERGRFVVLNNGIEYGVTYLVMLLGLFFTGGGRYVSVDYWMHHFSGGRSRG